MLKTSIVMCVCVCTCVWAAPFGRGWRPHLRGVWRRAKGTGGLEELRAEGEAVHAKAQLDAHPQKQPHASFQTHYSFFPSLFSTQPLIPNTSSATQHHSCPYNSTGCSQWATTFQKKKLLTMTSVRHPRSPHTHTHTPTADGEKLMLPSSVGTLIKPLFTHGVLVVNVLHREWNRAEGDGPVKVIKEPMVWGRERSQAWYLQCVHPSVC